MNFKKFLKILTCTTIVLLVYIHLQMKIFAMGYHTQASQKKIQELIDDNGRLTYQILTLKSANNLGKQVLAGEHSNLEFIEQGNIMQLTTQPSVPRIAPAPKMNAPSKAVDKLTKAFSWFTPQTAEAQGLGVKK